MLTTLLWRFCCFYMCPKVVLLNESNVALFPFRLHLVAEVLLFLYVYPHVVREVVKKNPDILRSG